MQRDALRRKAEKLARATSAEIQHMSLEELQRVVHELKVHQIELDLQNEEFRRTRLELEEVRDNYQDLFEWAPVGYALLDARATILQANARALQLLGVKRTDLIRRHIEKFIAPEDRHRFERYWHDVLSARTLQTCEFRLLPACPARHVRLKNQMLPNQEDERCRHLVAIVDLTKEMEFRRSLEAQRDFISAVLDTAGALVVVLDSKGQIVRFNLACEQTTGYAAEEVLGRRIRDLFLIPEEIEPVEATFQQLRDKRSNIHEHHWRTKRGELRWIAWTNTMLIGNTGEFEYVISTGIDQTEKKQAVLALERREHDLQALAGRLIRAQEDERTRLARELHDDASQRLASILFELDRVQDAMGLSNLQRRHLHGLRQKISALYDDVHGLSYALHPKILDDLGLDAAIRSLMRETGRYAALDIRHRTRQLPADLPAPVALCCYRVVQQALDNAIRHAQASRIRVSIAGFRACLGVCVADDGRGFDPNQISSRPSLGLLSMKERALALSGNVRVRSSPNHGTHVHLRIPLREIQPFQEDASSG